MESTFAEYQPSAVIHLAALTGAECEIDQSRTRKINVESVRMLRELSLQFGVARFVLASTAGVYGDRYNAPVSENSSLELGSAYAKSKREAELVFEDSKTTNLGLSAIALRIFNIYGPGMTDSLVNRLAVATSENPVYLAGLDTFVRDYVHVDDVAEALLKASTVSIDSEFKVLNIGAGRPVSNRKLVESIGAKHYALEQERISYSCANIFEAKRVLGFAPRQRIRSAEVLGQI